MVRFGKVLKGLDSPKQAKHHWLTDRLSEWVTQWKLEMLTHLKTPIFDINQFKSQNYFETSSSKWFYKVWIYFCIPFLLYSKETTLHHGFNAAIGKLIWICRDEILFETCQILTVCLGLTIFCTNWRISQLTNSSYWWLR